MTYSDYIPTGGPNLIVIGGVKCGSSSLHWHLNSHPAIRMSTPKELNFWNQDRYFDEGAPIPEALNRYVNSLPKSENGVIVGESSPQYGRFQRHPDVASRIFKVFPNTKLLFIARDPVSRCVSEYRHRVSNGLEDRPIDEALQDSRYLEVGRYYTALGYFREFAERGQLLVITLENLLSRPLETNLALGEYLEVSPALFGTKPPHVNRGEDRLMRLQWARSLHRVPGWSKIAQAAPESVRLRWRKVTSRNVNEVITLDISAETRRFLVEELHADSVMLGRVFGVEGVWSWPTLAS